MKAFKEEQKMNSISVEQVIDEIKARTKMTAYSLVINKDKKPDIFDSKFGGVPYWDLNKEYPVDNAGNMLVLLAQINLDNLDVDDRLPGKGMLQFFIGAEDLFGMDFDNQDNQNKFRVVYHEKIDYTVVKEQILGINPPVSSDFEEGYETPVFKESAVEIIKKEVAMGEGDYRSDKIFRDILREKFNYEIGNQSLFNVFSDEEYDIINNAISNEGHWLLGYPYFTQSDPREYNKEYAYYDTLLFQMDSDYIDDEYYTIWGDCGVGNFFINSEDLKKCDFSRVLYNWDCC